MEIINVNLYGGKGIFGGRETALEASIVYCDKYETCSYYKNNKCLNVRCFLSSRCKYGNVSNITGYTSKAAKYYGFKTEWQKHEKYSKLDYPSTKLGLIDGVVVFPYPYICIKESENGGLIIDDPGFGNSASFIDYDKFTVDIIKSICDFRPQAIMGGEIMSYKRETVPLFLSHLKEILPERYKELTDKYAEIGKEINYVGRKALLKTINPSSVQYKSQRYPQFNSQWYWDGEILIYKSGYISSFDITKDYEIQEIKLKPSDKSTVIILNNEQVNENTILVD
jgi:hypothetical protein